MIANGGEDALEGAAKLSDEGFQRVLRADLSPARQVRALRALDGTNPGELAVSPEGQQLALRMVADGGSDVTTFLRRAEVCSSPCDKVPDALLELQDGSELTTEELVSLGRQMGKYADDVGIDSVEEFAVDLGRLANAGDNGDPVEGFEEMIRAAGVQPGADSEPNIKGLVGEVEGATNILDNDARSLAGLEVDIETPRGKTDIDIDLEDGTAIEVKNTDYADVDEGLREIRLDELESKLQKFAEESDEVVIASRTSDSDVFDSLINNIESAYPSTNVRITTIENLDSI